VSDKTGEPHEAAALEAFPATELLLEHLQTSANPENVEGMAQFGINREGTLGVPVKTLRSVAREVLKGRRRDPVWRHAVAARLWDSGVHEARILASILDEPTLVTREQVESWVAALDSWDTTDQLCLNLLDKTPFAYELAMELAPRREEFVKRAGFALIACLAWHDKDAPDEAFLPFLDTIEREADDGRNYVTKAIDWALRNVGKRSVPLNTRALEVARRLAGREERSARRVGRVAAKELESDRVRDRLGL